MDYSESFNQHSDTLRSAREEADRDDLNHAMSGAETGRQRKHLPDDGRIDPLTGKKRRSAAGFAFDTLEWLLLNNPEYRQVHHRALETLQRVERAAQTALERAVQLLAAEQLSLDDILFRAATLPDGRKVFRDGRIVITENGEQISDDLAATIIWRGDEPTHSEFTAQRERVKSLEQSVTDLRGIETQLGDVRGELTDNEKPPSMERMEELEDRMQSLSDDVSIAIEHLGQLETSTNTPDVEVSSDNLSATLTIPIGGKP